MLTKTNIVRGSRRYSRRLGLLAGALSLTLVACQEPSGILPQNPNDALLLENGAVFRMEIEPGLEQTVELRNERLHTGDMLNLRSVVRNVSNTPKKVEALICSLEIRTDLDWDPHSRLILCFAYSMTTELAPRDSLVLTETGQINSRPGRYTMVVRHLLRPDIRARVRVNVHPKAE